mgnify:CR=1 FL=1
MQELCRLRDEEGLSAEHIVENFVFLTAGACGPCRFGMYVTEYRKALRDAGFELAFPNRRASHEFIVTLKHEAKSVNLTAMDVAKALLDKNYHAPTTYFPLLVPECLLIEPTESEAKEALDGFMDALEQIKNEAETDPELLHAAPQTLPVKRLDEVRAAKQLDLAYRAE